MNKFSAAHGRLLLLTCNVSSCSQNLVELQGQPSLALVRDLLEDVKTVFDRGFRYQQDPFTGDRPINFHGTVATSVSSAVMRLCENVLHECFREAGSTIPWWWTDPLMPWSDEPLQWMTDNFEELNSLDDAQLCQAVKRITVPDVDFPAWLAAENACVLSRRLVCDWFERQGDWQEVEPGDATDAVFHAPNVLEESAPPSPRLANDHLPPGQRKLLNYMLRKDSGTFEELRELDVWSTPGRPTDSAIVGRLKELRGNIVTGGYWFSIRASDFTWKWTSRSDKKYSERH